MVKRQSKELGLSTTTISVKHSMLNELKFLMNFNNIQSIEEIHMQYKRADLTIKPYIYLEYK